MKVLFYAPPLAFQGGLGGAEIQLLKTREALEKLGVEIVLFDPWRPCLAEVDVVHLFNPIHSMAGSIMARAHELGKPVVVSTIFWMDKDYLFAYQSLSKAVLKSIYFYVARKFLSSRAFSDRERVFLGADLLLPNSKMEADNIASFYAIPSERFHVVPNAISPNWANTGPELAKKELGISDFILCTGLFDPRKNQHRLIEAARQLNHPVVFIGGSRPGFERYYDRCRAMASDNPAIRFVPQQSHNSPLLQSAYAAASVFVLPSIHETPGLAALEAAMAGTRVVITQNGSTREYFGDLVEYVNPNLPTDIALKIERALSKSVTNSLRDHVIANFTWERVAHDTLRAYEKVLNG